MDSRHLHYLYEIIELGSLTRAAERLNITQPTLTRILRSMEARVGSPLVKRGRYGVTPTEIGLRLAEEGREIAQRAIRSDEVIEHWKLGMRGEVRLGVGPMMAASVMSSFFADFLDGSAPYSLLVKAGYTAKLIADLQEDEVDAVILPSKINLQQTALHQRPLFNDSLGVFCSESNLLARMSAPPSRQQLEAATWIDTAPVSGLFSNEAELLAQLGLNVSPPKLKFSGDLSMAIQVVAKTDALCILPRKLAARLPGLERQISEIVLDLKLPERNIALWTRQADADKPQLTDIFDRLTTYLEHQSFLSD